VGNIGAGNYDGRDVIEIATGRWSQVRWAQVIVTFRGNAVIGAISCGDAEAIQTWYDTATVTLWISAPQLQVTNDTCVVRNMNPYVSAGTVQYTAPTGATWTEVSAIMTQADNGWV
jgi:hypothetical protein